MRYPVISRSLHWLPIRHRITHKVATLTFKALHHHQPTYLYQLVNIYSPAGQLWSSGAGLLVKPETSNKTSDRAFAVAAATTWNRLPPKVRTATYTEQFSRTLKTHLLTDLVAYPGASDSLFPLMNYGAVNRLND